MPDEACSTCLRWTPPRSAPWGRCTLYDHPAYDNYGCPDWAQQTVMGHALLAAASRLRAQAAAMEMAAQEAGDA